MTSPFVLPRRLSCRLISLPLSPFHLQVRVTTPAAATAVTGRSSVALIFTASAEAAMAGVAAAVTVACTRTPPTYRFSSPASVAAPVTVTVAVATTPSSFCKGRHHTSPTGSTLRHASYIEASIEPAPPMLFARPRLGTSTRPPILSPAASLLTWATISRRIADDAVLAAELSISA